MARHRSGLGCRDRSGDQHDQSLTSRSLARDEERRKSASMIRILESLPYQDNVGIAEGLHLDVPGDGKPGPCCELERELRHRR